MRPGKESQSTLWAPLNRILGTEGNVRILRVLAQARRPIGRTEVARRADLDPSGVRRALDGLMLDGVVEAIGSGSRPNVVLREEHPLISTLRALFAAECQRAQAVYDSIRQLAEALTPSPQAVWIDLPEASTPAGTLGMIQVHVIDHARDVGTSSDAIREGLVEVAGRYDIQFDVRPLTRADIMTLPQSRIAALLETESIFGLPPAVLLTESVPSATGSRVSDHQDLDRQSLEVHRGIAAWIGRDPTLIDRAREHLIRRMEEVPAPVRKELQEWLDLIDTMPVVRLQRFLIDRSERASRLRQSSPFLSALTPGERKQLLTEVRNAA